LLVENDFLAGTNLITTLLTETKTSDNLKSADNSKDFRISVKIQICLP
jgi:hypothetical protein